MDAGEAGATKRMIEKTTDGWVMFEKPNEILDSPKADVIKAPDKLPAGYTQPAPGSKYIAMYSGASGDVHAVMGADGKVSYFYADGSTYELPGDGDVEAKNLANTAKYEKSWSLYDGYDLPMSAPKKSLLPDNYLAPPEGSKVIAVDMTGKIYAVKHPDGTMSWAYPSGYNYDQPAHITEQTVLGNTHSWKPVDPSNPATVIDANIDGVKDHKGSVLAVGDDVTVVKFNKGGLSNKAKVVSINKVTGKVKIVRLDDKGNQLWGSDGKLVYSTLDSKSLGKAAPKVVWDSSTGLPKGVSMSEGNPDSPMYGKPAPVAPKAPVSVGDSAGPTPLDLSPDFMERAEKAYAAYRAKHSPVLDPKALKDSSTAWNPINQAMHGDQAQLDHIKTKGYFGDEPALYEEIQASIDKLKASYSETIHAYEVQKAEYEAKHTEWLQANGHAFYTPLHHDDPSVLAMSADESDKYCKAKWGGILKTLSPKAQKGLDTQKNASNWQTYLRKMPAKLGFKKADIAEQAKTDPYSAKMDVWEGCKQAADEAGPVGEAFRASRTVSFDRFVRNDGSRFKEGDDLRSMIGSIQKDHGAMEIVPGSMDHGGQVVKFYNVYVDLVVPPEMKGVYTGAGSGNHNNTGENGMIMEPGLAMYIWDVVPYNGSYKVMASLIPPEVYPYMNYFEGDPDSHNIVEPNSPQAAAMNGMKKANEMKADYEAAMALYKAQKLPKESPAMIAAEKLKAEYEALMAKYASVGVSTK